MADILWSSNAPWSTSGYGNQTNMFVPRFQEELGHRMAVACFFGLEGGMVPGWADPQRGRFIDIPCYPTDISRFGAILLGEYAGHHAGGDRTAPLVMTLQDLWPLLPGIPNFQGVQMACWTPVDHDPVPPQVAEFIRQKKPHVIAMSQHGRKALEAEGFDPLYVPHAVDTSVFKPKRADRDAIRQTLKLPTDAFVVGMVANNQGLPSRKSFPQVFQAFSQFSKKHSDAIMYVHADVLGRNNGVNLIQLAQACGINPDVMRTSDQLALHLGIPQPLVADVFNCFDVTCMPSMGEGFGIPLIESQACGVPVITTDWTAMTELCGAGWLVDGDKWWDQMQGAYQKVPHVADILDALEDAYDKAEGMADLAVAFAQDYDVERVMKQWVPVLEHVTAPREVPALRVAA